ncbi:glycosyltransferase family 39 protein [Scytonema sp. NUACC26]|uniref:glycosyltransferase family 39 protein n=1 Tax=Scytonema sp. NUACC26 TaxID=3140176 RepID=UPI0034DCB305
MRQIKLAPYWLRFLIITVFAVGVFFRFYNLDTKVYSYDETRTSLRISGYTSTEVQRQIFNSRVVKREAFDKFQSLNSEKNLGDTLKSLAIDDPQRPPLYYLLIQVWSQLFGTSVTAIRSFSATVSLLVFPCLYWLCRELFIVPLSVPYVAIALATISPIHLVYAQEAQEYILWLVTILASSASLLRALRLETTGEYKRDYIYVWGLYTVTLALSLYTSLLSGFIAVAHGIYVTATAEFRWTQTVKAYTLASLSGFCSFIPWILIILTNFFQFHQTTWTSSKLPLFALFQTWLIQLSRIFFDLDFGLENPFSYLVTSIFFTGIGYSIYILCLTTHPKIWLFIVLLIAVPAIPLMLPDLMFGGIRSTAEQYLMPTYVGIQLAVAYLLATQLYNGNILRRRIWEMIFIVIILSGFISCAVISQKETLWNKGVSYGNIQIAKIINQSNRSLLICHASSSHSGNVVSLSYLVQPKVRFLLVKGKALPKVYKGFTDIFLLNPSSSLRKAIEKKYNAKTRKLYSDKFYTFWKLK